MKVGILTFHRALNYGALLQAYALKSKIEEIGHEVSIIDYRNDVIEKMYEYPSFTHQIGIKNKIKYIVQSHIEKTKRKNFELFRKNYLKIVSQELIYNRENIDKIKDTFDIYFTGSDQVWNPDAHAFDKTYLLDFISDITKKRSYAASFGVSSLEEKYKSDYKKLLTDFSICSVREKKGQEIITSLADIPTRVDVDPIFLLSKEEWQNSLFLHYKTESSYVLLYNFNLTPHQKNITRMCYERGLKVKYIGIALRNQFDFPCEYIGDAGPLEFMQLIYNASFIITNSFHGLSFAINFNIPFAVEYLINDHKVNCRLENMLELSGLEDRLIQESGDLTSLLDAKIDWNEVEKKLKPLKKMSINYLKNCLSYE